MEEVTGANEAYDDQDIRLAGRNRGMLIEGLRYDLTPTGMHYLLNHFDVPRTDPATWQLRVEGLVERPLSLSMADLQALPSRTLPVTLECAGNGRALLSPRPRNQPWGLEAIGTAEWTGAPLADVMALAGLDPAAVELVFTGADNGVQEGEAQDYQRSLTVAEASRPEILLVWGMNGRPLEPQYGAPLRLLVPGWYGMASVKWLTRIEAVAEPFRGFQMSAYTIHRSEDDAGQRVTRIRVRALMVPPGVMEFPSLRRLARPGRVELLGRAWSGSAPVTRVEVGIDDAWHEAELMAPVGELAWRGWRSGWQATPGEHVLMCRATDASGQTQPLEQDWNSGGYCNNMVQRIHVTVANEERGNVR